MFLKGIAREIISVFFVSIYCISLSPISFFNDHIESTTSCCEHHSQVLYCENLFQDLDISCSHESHVLILEERCDVGDCFTTSEKVVLNNAFRQYLALYNTDIFDRSEFIYLHDDITCLNKSPPYLL